MKNLYSKFIILIFVVLCMGCVEENTEPVVNMWIDITLYRVVSTSTTTYAHIEYEAPPDSRVFWTSPDTVIIEGEKTCIICCSTYTPADGVGHQLAILPDGYESRVWTVIGYINEEVADTIYIK